MPCAATGPNHIVQFYEHDGFLSDVVAEFLTAGLTAGQPVVVIATEPHRKAFADRLEAKGFDVEGARSSGQLTFLDVRALLSTFMVGAMPDAELFNTSVGAAIEKRLRGEDRSCLRVYGEMVDVLWKDGNAEAALRVEELWNDLASTHAFSLLCAYAIGNFYKEAHTHQFEEICRKHAHVVPAESYTQADSEENRLREISQLQQRARALETEIAHRKELENALRDALANRRRAEDALRQSEQELKDFVENAVEGLHWLGPDGIVLWANEAELELVGCSRDEYIGHHIAEFHADREVIDDVLARLARNETLRACEARLRCKDGSIRHVLINANVLWQDGKFVHTRCFTRDITERKHAEVERERLLAREQAARAEAENANRLKDEFLAILSHELRTPLNAILGWTQIANGRRTDEATIRRALEVIGRNAASQMHLVDGLLDVSRIVTGKMQIAADPVDLVAVVKAATDGVRPAAVAKAVDLNVRCDDSVHVVTGDAGRMQQVIWNLLSNAVKFTPKDGRVEVRLERAGSDAQIVVQDTGQGIAPEFLPHAFDRFRQADGSTTRKHGGLGLGLAVVRHLVEAHGGTVSADSAGEGLGATFTVRLPLRAAPADVVVGRALPQQPVVLEDTRVLVVDDDPGARELVQYVLEQSGAAVESAASADEALCLVSTKAFNVLLADIGMPDRDGYALIAAIRSHAQLSVRDLGAVAVTAYAGDAQRAKVIAAGYDDYVTKPIDTGRLAHIISELVARKAAAQP